MAEVRFDRRKTYTEALEGNSGTIYFTKDTNDIVLDGKSYSTRRILNTSLDVEYKDEKYTVTVTGVDDITNPGDYYCYPSDSADSSAQCFKLIVTWVGTDYIQTIRLNYAVADLNPGTDYIYRVISTSNDGKSFGDWIVVKDDHNSYWSE